SNRPEGIVSAPRLPAVAIVGTDRLGRPLTAFEKECLGELLRVHDYVGARLVALRFALKLARNNPAAAQDLMGRADLRLVRWGWDPNEVPLVKRLCRLVWSEWTHAVAESDSAQRAEETFLKGMEVTEGRTLPSPEDIALRHEDRGEAKRGATAQL